MFGFPGGRCVRSTGCMTRILVVEDESAIAELVSEILTDEGYETAIAEHGAAALTFLHAIRPDVVLSDIMMPQVDGHELCRRMRLDPDYVDIPVVLMSAGPTPAMSSDCDFSAFIPKPFTLFTLITTISQVVEAPTARGSGADVAGY